MTTNTETHTVSSLNKQTLAFKLDFSLLPIANYPVLSTYYRDRDARVFIEAFFHIFSINDIHTSIFCSPESHKEPLKQAVCAYIRDHITDIYRDFLSNNTQTTHIITYSVSENAN